MVLEIRKFKFFSPTARGSSAELAPYLDRSWRSDAKIYIIIDKHTQRTWTCTGVSRWCNLKIKFSFSCQAATEQLMVETWKTSSEHQQQLGSLLRRPRLLRDSHEIHRRFTENYVQSQTKLSRVCLQRIRTGHIFSSRYIFRFSDLQSAETESTLSSF